MSSRRRRAATRANEAVQATPAANAAQTEERLSGADLISILVASLLILWRAQSYPIGGIWCDWVVIVSGYWIFTIVAGKSRAWGPVTVGVMAFLLFVFASGNLPKVLEPFGWKQ